MQASHEHIRRYQAPGKKHGKQDERRDDLSERQSPFGKYKGAHKGKDRRQGRTQDSPKKGISKGGKKVLVMGNFSIGGKIKGQAGQKTYFHSVRVLGLRKRKGQHIQKRIKKYNN
jgi:hypothetical protein